MKEQLARWLELEDFSKLYAQPRPINDKEIAGIHGRKQLFISGGAIIMKFHSMTS